MASLEKKNVTFSIDRVFKSFLTQINSYWGDQFRPYLLKPTLTLIINLRCLSLRNRLDSEAYIIRPVSFKSPILNPPIINSLQNVRLRPIGSTNLPLPLPNQKQKVNHSSLFPLTLPNSFAKFQSNSYSLLSQFLFSQTRRRSSSYPRISFSFEICEIAQGSPIHLESVPQIRISFRHSRNRLQICPPKAYHSWILRPRFRSNSRCWGTCSFSPHTLIKICSQFESLIICVRMHTGMVNIITDYILANFGFTGPSG